MTIVDTFIDEGHSARTFDRPDIKELFSFIKKNYRNIDYLIVAELTRFSRKTGPAIDMVESIQNTYGINTVSARRGQIYDVNDSNSFLMMGLEFLMGNSDNIKRQTDINGGIYTAKTSGRWIQGGPAPFGFKKEGIGKDRHLVINEPEAAAVRFIYESFLRNTPPYVIKEEARKMGFKRTSRSAIQDILKNPLYMGYQEVKAWKNKPGGLFPLKNLSPIIEENRWYQVQEKFKPQRRVIIREEYPLRGVLKCWCGKCMTGAASRNGSGKYIDYYKCQVSGHNNINAVRAHDQLNEILNLMSLPPIVCKSMEKKAEMLLGQHLKDSRQIITVKKSELEATENKLESIEEKFIANQLNFESYEKWHRQLAEKRNQIRAGIQSLEKDDNRTHFLLKNTLAQLTDLGALYSGAATVEKQELIRQVFDNRLYYRNRAYRTPFIMPVFAHNSQILSQKQSIFMLKFNKSTFVNCRSLNFFFILTTYNVIIIF